MNAHSLLAFICSVSLMISTTEDRYTNSAFNFELTPPSLSGTAPVMPVQFYLPAENGFAGNMNIQVQPWDKGLNEYKMLSLSQMKQYGLEVIFAEIKKSNGLEFFEIEYKGAMNTVPLYFFARGYKSSKGVILITASMHQSSKDRQYPIFKKSVESFKLK